MKTFLRLRFLIGASAIAVAAIATAIFVKGMGHPTPKVLGAAAAQEVDGVAKIARVNTIHPKKNPAFVVSVQQLALVRAFYMVDLKTRVAGAVKTVKTVIGDHVKAGDVLIEIDVPDLEKEVLQKRSTVDQRKEEVRIAQAKVKSAQAFVEVAKASIAQQQAGVTQATASRDYRKKRLDRFRDLFKRQVLTEDVVEEQEKEWLSGEGALEMAKASVDKANADFKEKEADLETAQVDVDLKKAQVDVAAHDLERSQALLGYATIAAPFDGVITKRNVDPGHFVQNATSGQTDALLSLARIDIVTVVAKVPDNAAPFIGKNTAVEIQIDQLPGANIQAKITRFSPSIDSSDRTMRVEVDLLNSKAADTEIGATPVFDLLAGKQLLPGMNGYMRLRLNELADAHLVPSSAVFSRGGKQFVMLVENGKTRMAPAFVQVNDGNLAKIALVQRDSAGRTTLVDLTGREEIVANRQAELDDGQAVQTNLQDW